MAAVTLTDVQEDLAYLLGEQSAPSTTSSDYNSRSRFIQRALERAYRAYNFPFNKVNATVALTNGVATLASGVLQDSVLDVRIINSGTNDDKVLTQVPYEEQDKYGQGSYVYWLTGYENAYQLHSKESDNTLTIRYTTSVPVINASIATPFPSAMALARGALIFYRQAEDPQADIGQEEALFQAEIEDIITMYNRSRPQQRLIGRHEYSNTYIGDAGHLD